MAAAARGGGSKRTPAPLKGGRGYGPVWGLQRPPGLPRIARQALQVDPSTVRARAAMQGLGRGFEGAAIHMAAKESAFMLARPADRFDARCLPSYQGESDYELAARGVCTLVDGTRAGGPLVTAWGLFQWNRDAWRDSGGPGLWPWDATPEEEMQHPLHVYAQVWRQAAARARDPVRAVFLWQASPVAWKKYRDTGTVTRDVERHVAAAKQLA